MISAQRVYIKMNTGLSSRIQLYRELSKSGIVTLVLISVLGGYLIGQPFEIPLSWTRLFLTLAGILLLASGSSALNQLQERHIDREMPRTAKRPLPSGRITPMGALVFVVITISCGLALLLRVDRANHHNGLPLFWLGVAAVLSYNGLYTLWWKRHWAFAAVPGAIPGALPILMGHIAANGQLLNPAGIYLFFILFYWQMPHFWVLALKFEDDYRSGGFPTLPVAHGSRVTVRQIVIWCFAYVLLAMIGPFFLKTGWIYLVAATLTSIMVLWELFKFAFAPEPQKAWLRFFLWVNFSLIIYLAAAAADLWSIYLPNGR
jgi:protoheme IX farnesyltransferase